MAAIFCLCLARCASTREMGAVATEGSLRAWGVIRDALTEENVHSRALHFLSSEKFPAVAFG